MKMKQCLFLLLGKCLRVRVVLRECALRTEQGGGKGEGENAEQWGAAVLDEGHAVGASR